MALPQGIPFQDTATFVTHGPDDSVEHSAGAGFLGTATYPRVTAQGQTVGWEIAGGSVSTRNRNAGIDPRLAGGHFNTNVGKETFRIDLPSAGPKNVRIAMGDANYTTSCDAEILDTAASLGAISSGTTGAANHWRDAASVERTSDSDWATNNVAAALTFATTIMRCRIGDGVGSGHTMSYLYVEDGSPPPPAGQFLSSDLYF